MKLQDLDNRLKKL